MNMKTTLKIRSNYPTDEREVNDRLKDFVSHLTGNEEPNIEYANTKKESKLCPVFCLTYDDQQSLKETIAIFDDHRYIPFDGFDDIAPDDFTMTLESDTIDDSYTYLTQKNFDYIEEQVNMIDYICSDIVNEQEDLREKVEALYSFFDKSGILYYKQVIQGLLDVLDSKGIIEKEGIESKLFTKHH